MFCLIILLSGGDSLIKLKFLEMSLSLYYYHHTGLAAKLERKEKIDKMRKIYSYS